MMLNLSHTCRKKHADRPGKRRKEAHSLVTKLDMAVNACTYLNTIHTTQSLDCRVPTIQSGSKHPSITAHHPGLSTTESPSLSSTPPLASSSSSP